MFSINVDPFAVNNFTKHNAYQKKIPSRTLNPTTTGSSVLGLKFDGGVVIAADMLGSYGSMARFRSCSRVLKVNNTTVMAAGGDYADYQHLSSIIEQRVIDEENLNDGFSYTPLALFSWLTRVMYSRRSNFNPLWNTVIIGGLQHNEPFLGYVDKIGTAYQSTSVASGYGAHIAQPMMRDALEKNPTLTATQAVELIDQCLKVLFYRDARSLNKYEVAVITKDGVEIKGPIVSETNWQIAHLIEWTFPSTTASYLTGWKNNEIGKASQALCLAGMRPSGVFSEAPIKHGVEIVGSRPGKAALRRGVEKKGDPRSMVNWKLSF